MLFPPPLPWAVMVLQNRPNVCFPSKGWLNSHTGSISQATLRPPSVIACSCGGRSLITRACCSSCPPFTSSADDLTGEARCEKRVLTVLQCTHLLFDLGKTIWRKYTDWSWVIIILFFYFFPFQPKVVFPSRILLVSRHICGKWTDFRQVLSIGLHTSAPWPSNRTRCWLRPTPTWATCTRSVGNCRKPSSITATLSDWSRISSMDTSTWQQLWWPQGTWREQCRPMCLRYSTTP